MMTLDEMEAQAHRALDGMKVNTNVMAQNQLRLIALVRNSLAAAEKKPADAGKPAQNAFGDSFGAALDEVLGAAGRARGGRP